MRSQMTRLIAIAFVSTLCICAVTACKKNVEPPKVVEPEITEENQVGDAQYLEFTDARGGVHNVSIDPGIYKNDYDKEAFIKNGDYLSYEDDQYYSRRGIDVSSHQGDIKWEAVKEEGYGFAIIRAGFRGYGEAGSLNTDERFKENIEGAKAAGLDVGIYFFSQAINEEEARQEARYVLDIIGEESLALGICFDPENILDDVARTDNVTGEQFTKNALAFYDVVEEAGYDPFIYCNMIWESEVLDLKPLQNHRIWYADYINPPQTPYMFDFLQYSENGRVEGIDGPVDLDIQILRK